MLWAGIHGGGFSWQIRRMASPSVRQENPLEAQNVSLFPLSPFHSFKRRLEYTKFFKAVFKTTDRKKTNCHR